MNRSPFRTPQSELPIASEPFALVPEGALDGDRVTRERVQSAQDRAEADTHQLQIAASV